MFTHFVRMSAFRWFSDYLKGFWNKNPLWPELNYNATRTNDQRFTIEMRLPGFPPKEPFFCHYF